MAKKDTKFELFQCAVHHKKMKRKLVIYYRGCPTHAKIKLNRTASLSLYLGKQMGEGEQVCFCTIPSQQALYSCHGEEKQEHYSSIPREMPDALFL